MCFLDSKKLCLLLCILEGQPTLWLLTHPVESNLLHIFCRTSLFAPLFCFYTSLAAFPETKDASKRPHFKSRESNWVLSHLGDSSGQREGKTHHCFTSCVLWMAFHLALPAFVIQNAAVSASIPVWHFVEVFTQGWGLAWGPLASCPEAHSASDGCISQVPRFCLPTNYLSSRSYSGAMIWIYPLRNVY